MGEHVPLQKGQFGEGFRAKGALPVVRDPLVRAEKKMSAKFQVRGENLVAFWTWNWPLLSVQN